MYSHILHSFECLHMFKGSKRAYLCKPVMMDDYYLSVLALKL